MKSESLASSVELMLTKWRLNETDQQVFYVIFQ